MNLPKRGGCEAGALLRALPVCGMPDTGGCRKSAACSKPLTPRPAQGGGAGRVRGRQRSAPLLSVLSDPRSRLLRKGLPGFAEGRSRNDRLGPVLSSGTLAVRQWLRAPSTRPFRSRWDREFASPSLQRRVQCEPDFLEQGAEQFLWARQPREIGFVAGRPP
jgi:hypothetical protein